jgi:Rieske Fe-S protein
MADVCNDEAGASDSCGNCPLIERRTFVRDVSFAVATLFGAMGITPAAAAGAAIGVTRAGRGAREEKTYAIPPVDGAQIDRENGAILMRWQGKVYVYSLACPHQNTAVRWSDKNTQFECPKHHSRYLPDGEYVKDSGRATRGLDRFAVRRDGDNIVANLDRLYQQNEDQAPWSAAFVTL